MVKWSYTSENVLSQLQIIQIQHTYVISSQKIKNKKIEPFGPTLLRNFPLKKSGFLGIFINVLTGFYCTYFEHYIYYVIMMMIIMVIVTVMVVITAIN
jgi:hypothetical protein